MKKAIRFCFFFILALAGTLTGRVIRVYTDFKAHPQMYAPPYQTWPEALRMDFLIYGSAIIICIVALIVLKVLQKKREAA